MNSLRRMLAVLQLIRPQRPTVDIELIQAELGYPQATAYRYVRELLDVGLLVRLPGGWGLGPRIIEFDLMIRESDPLLNRSRDLMRDLVAQTGLNVLLSALYEDTVISIHQEYGLDARELNFGRGRPMPLFRSATSRVILAHLPPRRLKRLHDARAALASGGANDANDANDASDASDASDGFRALGPDWRSFSRAMLAIRRQGWCQSQGELDPDKTGLAAPILDDAGRVLGSITLVGSSERFAAFQASYLCGLVTQAGREITRRVAAGVSEGD
jgi:DNA-binding IclR family transcriptional regulator